MHGEFPPTASASAAAPSQVNSASPNAGATPPPSPQTAPAVASFPHPRSPVALPPPPLASSFEQTEMQQGGGGVTPARSEPSSESAVVDFGLESCSLNSGGGAKACCVAAASATAELATMSARIDRPHDVALEYNRSALLRWAVVLAVMAAPLLYLTPVVGVLVCPSAALVAFWSWQRARFVHGGDMRACVNRDCSVVVGIVFISIALIINVFNVGDLVLESDKTKVVTAKSGSSALKAASMRPPLTATTATTLAARSAATATTVTTQEDFGHTLPPEILYAHKHEIASQSASLRRAELILNSVLFIPALVTLRHLVRVSKLTHSSSADEGE